MGGLPELSCKERYASAHQTAELKHSSTQADHCPDAGQKQPGLIRAVDIGRPFSMP